MTSKSTVPPVSGSDDARSADTAQAENDRRQALKDAQSNASPAIAGDTETHNLAREYVRLGGHRRSKIDDNITDVRQWEEDPPEAERFWKERIETLSAGRSESETGRRFLSDR